MKIATVLAMATILPVCGWCSDNPIPDGTIAPSGPDAAILEMDKKLASGEQVDPQALRKSLEKAFAEKKPTSGSVRRPVTDADVENLRKNAAGIKELFERAEAAYKAEHFREATLAYKSVSLATVPGSEDYAAQSRDRLIDIESKAKAILTSARDKDTLGEYVNEAQSLELLHREFADTAAGKQSVQEMAALRSRPQAAAFLDLEQAMSLLRQGKVPAAVEQLNAVADNPNYQNTVAALQARARAKALLADDELRKAIDAANAAKSERAAKALLAQAQNLLKNSANDKATAALNEIVTLYPNTTVASDAKKLLDSVK